SIRVGRRREFAAFHRHDCVGAGPEGPFPQKVPDPQAASTLAASCLTWSWAGDPHKAGLRRLYQDLLSVRQHWPALRNFSQRAARWLPGQAPNGLLELIRGACHPEPGRTLQVYCNLTVEPQLFIPPTAPTEA